MEKIKNKRERDRERKAERTRREIRAAIVK